MKPTVEIVDTWEGLQALAPVWNSLLAQSDVDVPFLTHEWLTAWWESFGRGRELFVLVVKGEGKIWAIAPLMRTVRRRWGIPLRTVEFLANRHSCRTSFLLGPEKEAAIARLVDFFQGEFPEWDEWELILLPENSDTLRLLQAELSRRGIFHGTMPDLLSPYIPIETTWKEFLASKSSHFRSELRRKRRRLEKRGRCDLQLIRETENLQAILGRIFRLTTKTWTYELGTALVSRPEVRQFYTRLAERAQERGWLYFALLTLEGQDLAFEYSLRYKGKVYNLKIGYDAEFRKFSPGLILKAFVLEQAFQEAREFDLLGQASEFKQRWTPYLRHHVDLLVFNRHLVPWSRYLWQFQVKPHLRPLSRVWNRVRALIPRPVK